ncbi:hypothetical protein [Acetobacter okinawensis]|uniref:hypothetical protein n=1 Tax=Acetobacter okinawensis TaxID=1076594 RepID=UPI000A72F277|nr:hypothetical protein [Acetobacter okinawensis]
MAKFSRFQLSLVAGVALGALIPAKQVFAAHPASASTGTGKSATKTVLVSKTKIAARKKMRLL